MNASILIGLGVAPLVIGVAGLVATATRFLVPGPRLLRELLIVTGVGAAAIAAGLALQ